MSAYPVSAALLGFLLFICAAVFGVFAVAKAPATYDELIFWETCDLGIGLLFASAFYLFRVGNTSAPAAKTIWGTTIGCVLIWLFVWWFLILVHLHLFQLKTALDRSRTAHSIAIVSYALERYKNDCGNYPTEQQNLNALVHNPGVKNWAGPYMREYHLTDAWDNPLYYSVRNGVARIWSTGTDPEHAKGDPMLRSNDD